MLKFVEGDLFDFEADVRVNTVNCVGVMGKGVALAFKERYPSMFRAYKEACDMGEVEPGRMHTWTSPDGTTIVNFPTKRHWRHKSRYEDIEQGLSAFRKLLDELGDVRVTLPALGCGHGGLDWERVSKMIRDHLDGIAAEVLVFNPTASRGADKSYREDDEATKELLEDLGIEALRHSENRLPHPLPDLGFKAAYVKGDSNVLSQPFVSLACSHKPTDREINAAKMCVAEMAQAGVPIATGFSPKIERQLVLTALDHGSKVIVCIPTGILDFKVPRDFKPLWNKDLITLVSVSSPRQKWSSHGARNAFLAMSALSSSTLVTDVEPKRWSSQLSQALQVSPVQVCFVDYQQNGADVQAMKALHAIPIRRNKDSGKPNLEPIISRVLDRQTVPPSRQIAESDRVIENPKVKVETVAKESGQVKYPKRLIEVDLPIARISAHARREKSIRHGHISTLHIWWARRPLAACRAVICASLWPDPADELCPQGFRDAAVEQITAFANRVFPKKLTAEGKLLSSEKHLSMEGRARWESIADGTMTLDANESTDMGILRLCLLDFIADFSNWDNCTVPAYLECSQALTVAAHETLGGVKGTRPLVLDPFAGGGAIPLEASRVGAEAFASDLNPIAIMLNKTLVELIPKYGRQFGDELRKWGQWVKDEAERELAILYPKDLDGATPIAYIWARTIKCEGPACGLEVPLFKSTSLSTDGSSKWYFDPKVKANEIDIQISNTPNSKKTLNGWAATCVDPNCSFTTSKARVQSQLTELSGGAANSRLLCVVTHRHGERGKHFRNPTADDYIANQNALMLLEKLKSEIEPLSAKLPTKKAHRAVGSQLPLYGFVEYKDLFTPRQLATLAVLSKTVKRLPNKDSELFEAVNLALSFCISKQADYLSSLCRWRSDGAYINPTLGGEKKYVMISDFAEGCPFSEGPGNWLSQVDWVSRVLEQECKAISIAGQAIQANAENQILPSESAAALVTDPPYYDSVPYSDLSNFYYVWLRQAVFDEGKWGLDQEVAPKTEEATVDHPNNKEEEEQYRVRLQNAFSASREATQANGIGLIVFAHKSTSGWESLLNAIIDAGWCLTASWPIDTEMQNRLNAKGTASLASSVHLVCRPRENSDGTLLQEIGEWRDVLSELPKRIHEWMPRLAAEGVVGADAIFACLGPALEVFSRYSRVEKASGEAVPLREYLEQVWGAVSTEALSMIFKDADAAGLEPDARITAMWLWTLGAGAGDSNGNGSDDKIVTSKGYTLEFDAARKIAQGLGIHLEESESIVEVKGDKARLLPVSERTKYLFGKNEANATTARGKKKKKEQQRQLFEELDELEAEANIAGELKPQAGETVLDRVHQSMILFASGRGEALKRFLVEDGAGTDARFWKLAQSLSALYPTETDEKRWVDGVLARKKGLGL